MIISVCFLHYIEKNRASPVIAFRFRHGVRLRLYEQLSTGKQNDRRYSHMKYLSNRFRILYINNLSTILN